MRVKRLEIQGFKSFKDKTVIHFDHGITGIVGPNGCGKSNIVDAFFWVMGEQSYKHMRGSSSDDLIFNGSSKYSPLGVAEATMVLETDVADTANAPAGATTQDIPIHLRAKEIAVTRRLYRDGSGEYFINGVPARLKDIQELFMDTGVGAKGYSVIEQGQIGKIVNSKPEDRRLLIEEAAGIAKYKARKKESLRKMEATQANLSRLSDVIQEIERGLSSLERQAQKARLYHKYKAELLEKELTWGRRKSAVLTERLNTLKAERDQLEQELAALRAELQTGENAIEIERTAQLTDTKAAEAKQASIQLLADELTRQKSALDLSRKRQGDLATQLDRLGEEKSQLESAIVQSRAQSEEQQAGSAEAQAQLEHAQSQLSSAQTAALDASRTAQAARSRVDQAKREHLRAITESSELTSSVAAQLARAQSAVAQAERVLAQIQATQERHAQAAAQFETTRTAQTVAQAQLERLRTEKRQQLEQTQGAESALKIAERERETENRSLTQIKSRLQSLEDLVENNAGMADGPKTALEWAKAQGMNLDALAASFNTDADNASVLDTWLDQQFQGLMASGDAAWASAVGSVATVRDHKQGRIQVWLDAARAKSAFANTVGASELATLGFTGIQELSSLVQGESQLARDLIGGVWVVDQFPAQLSVEQLARIAGTRLVSRDGMALDATGILRGGTKDTSGATGLIKRKRQIDELRAQLAEQELKVATSEQSYTSAREALEMTRARLATLQGELQAAEIESASLSRDAAQMERQLRDLDAQLGRERSELTRAEQESARAEQQRTELEARLALITDAQSGREGEIAGLESELAQLEAQARELDAAYQGLRLLEAQARERAQSLRRELDGTLSVLRDREKRISDIERILERAAQERAGHSGGDSSLENQIAELTTRLADERTELAQIKDRLEQASGALNGFLESVKAAHKSVDEKSSTSMELAIELERVSGDLSHLVQDLEQKYGPGCLDQLSASVPNDAIQDEMTAPVVTAEMTAEEEQLLGEEVERIRERIRRLGEFNPMAVEEFEEAKKRHDHLLSERNDLEQSMANLQDAIDHINKTSEERFRKAFHAIADRFERLFPIIFGGGSAKLSLVYPEGSTDILEAGCDILAQPPGKKVSNIGLLSGGEKALTAVSLIFAIFMVKPSPFCVLDEVDAPLDDANIGKFNALLREMSSKSQFIVITHNKKTMELNDALYGVTMEEPGVSKMVSIELS